MASDVELKACPFCGKPPHAYETENGFRIECDEYETCIVGTEVWCELETDAITAWNTRPIPTQEQREAVARIVDPRLADDEWVRNFRMYVNEVQDIALAKADAILALLQPQGREADHV